MNNGWKTITFGKCAQLIKETYKPVQTESIPYIGLEHIEQNSLQLIGIGNSSETISNKFKFKKGDILFGKLRSYFRKVVWPDFDGVCSTDIFVVRAKEGTDQGFLYYWMASQEFVDLSDLGSTGTRMPRADWDFLCNIEQEIPADIKVQQGISEILSTLDQEIKNFKKQNKTLEKLIQSIFKSWFIEFDGQTEFEDSELGEIPKNWEVLNMPELIEINPSRNLKKGSVSPYLGMTDIPINSSRISEFSYREFNSGTKFMNGDTLLARITPSLENGKTAFVDFLKNDEIGWGSTEYIVLRPRNPFPPEYGYCLARTDELRSHAILNMTGTSGRQRVPDDCFAEYKVMKPSIELIDMFTNISRKIFLKIKTNGEMIHVLTKIRDSLLPKLMSGDLKVNN